ncbi:MAG: hypothetical protein M1812_007659 [Candelaria pacifica]|nr:MAG: hypothetical protein M1812_007659 [Candelaria pacifica]
MTSTKIFATGVTGYIGGDALYAISQAHPEFEWTCLVRNSDRGGLIASQYRKAKLVYGTLDDTQMLEEEAKKANVVLNFANADHEAAATALCKGLAAHSPKDPGYLIHTSGTGLLLVDDIQAKTYGWAASKIYDDWDGLSVVTSLPDDAPHRKVEKLVLNASEEHSISVKTAIVSPPTIYGKGRGPGNQRGHQVYELARCTIEKQEGLQVGNGENFWPNVHVYDLSDCYLKLVEAAVKGDENVTWNKEGYYFTENGEHVWGEISRRVAMEVHDQGLTPSGNVRSIDEDEANKLTPMGAALWGANSRCRSIRAGKLLGWTPKERILEEELPDVVASEAQRLKLSGVIEGHAAKVAG